MYLQPLGYLQLLAFTTRNMRSGSAYFSPKKNTRYLILLRRLHSVFLSRPKILHDYYHIKEDLWHVTTLITKCLQQYEWFVLWDE